MDVDIKTCICWVGQNWSSGFGILCIAWDLALASGDTTVFIHLYILNFSWMRYGPLLSMIW